MSITLLPGFIIEANGSQYQTIQPVGASLYYDLICVNAIAIICNKQPRSFIKDCISFVNDEVEVQGVNNAAAVFIDLKSPLISFIKGEIGINTSFTRFTYEGKEILAPEKLIYDLNYARSTLDEIQAKEASILASKSTIPTELKINGIRLEILANTKLQINGQTVICDKSFEIISKSDFVFDDCLIATISDTVNMSDVRGSSFANCVLPETIMCKDGPVKMIFTKNNIKTIAFLEGSNFKTLDKTSIFTKLGYTTYEPKIWTFCTRNANKALDNLESIMAKYNQRAHVIKIEESFRKEIENINKGVISEVRILTLPKEFKNQKDKDDTTIKTLAIIKEHLNALENISICA